MDSKRNCRHRRSWWPPGDFSSACCRPCWAWQMLVSAFFHQWIEHFLPSCSSCSAWTDGCSSCLRWTVFLLEEFCPGLHQTQQVNWSRPIYYPRSFRSGWWFSGLLCWQKLRPRRCRRPGRCGRSCGYRHQRLPVHRSWWHVKCWTRQYRAPQCQWPPKPWIHRA